MIDTGDTVLAIKQNIRLEEGRKSGLLHGEEIMASRLTGTVEENIL